MSNNIKKVKNGSIPPIEPFFDIEKGSRFATALKVEFYFSIGTSFKTIVVGCKVQVIIKFLSKLYDI